jgi:hypothetical protein
MLDQGVKAWYGDWHSPFISYLLGTFNYLGHPIGALFLLQLILWFVGFALISDTLLAAGYQRTGFVVALAVLFPLTSYPMVDVNKDGLLSASCLALVGMGVRHQLYSPKWSVGKLLAVVALMLTAFLSRLNGIFVVLPLMLIFVRRPPKTWPQCFKLAAASVAVVAALFGAKHVLERHLLAAAQFHMLQVLALYDVGGMTYNANADVTDGLFGPDFVAVNARCYDPTRVNSYTWGQKCNDFFFATILGPQQQSRNAKQALSGVDQRNFELSPRIHYSSPA